MIRSPRTEARMRAKKNLVKVAAAADVAVGTVRLYEAAPEAVRDDVRARLDAVYAGLSDAA